MRNFKKLIAVVVTLVMLLTVASFGVSANTAPTISLVGMPSTGTTVEGTYYDVQVKLADTANAVGGIEGTITFDAPLTLADVVLSDTFVAAGNTEENSVAVSGNAIKFVGLATGDGVWFTLKFTVAKSDDTSATVAFANVKGAKADGSDYVTVDTKDLAVSVVNNDIVAAGGAAIKVVDTVDAQDIMFQALVDAEALEAAYPGATVKKIGAVMGVAQKLDGVELVADINNSYAVSASTEYDKAEDFAVNLNKMTAALVGVKIVSRVYIVVNYSNEDITIYSNNYDMDYSVDNGCARRSVLQVAKKAVKLAQKNGFDDVAYTDGTMISAIVDGNIAKDTALRNFIFAYIKDAEAAGYLTVEE